MPFGPLEATHRLNTMKEFLLNNLGFSNFQLVEFQQWNERRIGFED